MTSSVTWPFDSSDAISYRCSIVTESLSPAMFEIMGPKHIGVTTLTFLDHVASSVTWPIDPLYVISYWCNIGIETVSLTVFEIFASKYIWVTTWTFLGHVTSLVTWPFDSPGAIWTISYRCSIVTKSLSPAIFEIMGPKHIGVTTLTFLGYVTSSVTSPIDPPYVISYWCPIVTKPLSLAVFELFGPQYQCAHTDGQKHRQQVIL